jgi:integrase
LIKKKQFNSTTEVTIFDEALVYKRNGHWQFRMYLRADKRYVVKSLQTTSMQIAIDKGKDLFHEIYSQVKSGKKLFSLTTKEAVQLYLDYRKIDVSNGTIVSGRYGTITTHLEHFLDFIGRDTRLRDIQADSAEDYYSFRSAEASQSTIQNEQSTINALCKWLHSNNYTSFQSLIFRRLKKIDKRAEDVRRATFTPAEYKQLYIAARAYVKQKGLESEEYLQRELTRHWILINANCGMRNGEARQLRWADIQVIRHKMKDSKDELDAILVTLSIRSETSKVRNSRRVICRGGVYFERLKEILQPSDNNCLVFSIDGVTEFSEKLLLRHFYAIVKLARIDRYADRGIVPYSLRHYMITDRLRAGLKYHNVAMMVGNSASEIEKTYYHLWDDERIEHALATKSKQ